MIILVRLLGLVIALAGVLRICGVPLILNLLERAVFEQMDDGAQRRYLIFTGLSALVGGVLWFVLISRAF